MSSDLPAALSLTPKQAAFVQAFVELGDAGKAAEAAGYGSSKIAGYRLAKHPALLAAIRYETAKRLQALAPVALTVLEDIMLNEKADPRVRRQCAVDVLSRAGHMPPTARDKAGEKPDRPLAELSEAELLALLQTLRKSQAEEAQLVQTEAEAADNAPINAPINAPKSDRSIDMFE